VFLWFSSGQISKSCQITLFRFSMLQNMWRMLNLKNFSILFAPKFGETTLWMIATSSTSLKWEKKTLMEPKQEELTCIRCKWQFSTKKMHLHNDKCQEHPSTMTYNLGLPSVPWRNTISSKYSNSHPHSETHIFPQPIYPIAWKCTKHKGSGLSP
jgi:hypothetical protein